MKKLKAVILGYGDRSGRYAEYSFIHPEELEIIGVIDVLSMKLEMAKNKFHLEDKYLFNSLDDFLKADIKCDFIINGTMDQFHYVTSIPLIKKGYNLLLEKPITGKSEELLEIRREAKKHNVKIIVCHVLRYTPFYSTIKKIINSGEIGKIVDMQLNEHVWYGHFVNSYVRGKWRSEKICGSGLLLAKCCHDTDLMCWLNNITTPENISSFGSKSFFTKENAPKDSTEFCYNCPCKNECMFDAYKFELEKDFIPFYTWEEMKKPIDTITRKEKEDFLKRDVYGKCVYKTDMDIVDRQCVSLEFKNGSIGTLNMIGGASKAGRHIHIICEYGEIVGYVEENKFTLRRFNKNKVDYEDEEIDVSNKMISGKKDNSVAGHYGGDYFIMKDIVSLLNGESVSASTTTIEDSINSHLVCYAAEKSRKEHIIVNIDKEFNKN